MAGAHLTGGGETVRKNGPDGTDYTVQHTVQFDVTEEATPEDTAEKMSLIRQATSLMSAQSAQEQIATSNALVLEARAQNEIEKKERAEKKDAKREYVSQPVERLNSPPSGQVVPTALLRAQLNAAADGQRSPKRKEPTSTTSTLATI